MSIYISAIAANWAESADTVALTRSVDYAAQMLTTLSGGLITMESVEHRDDHSFQGAGLKEPAIIRRVELTQRLASRERRKLMLAHQRMRFLRQPGARDYLRRSGTSTHAQRPCS